MEQNSQEALVFKIDKYLATHHSLKILMPTFQLMMPWPSASASLFETTASIFSKNDAWLGIYPLHKIDKRRHKVVSIKAI